MRGATQPLLRAMRDGAAIGLTGAALFLVLHAPIVQPIWDAWPRAFTLGPLSGAILAAAFHRLQREPLFRGLRGGALLGAFAGLALAPFIAAGWLRTRGAPVPFWALILGLLLISLYQLTQAAQREPGALRRAELFAAILAANWLPAYFLTFISDFHEETPNPFPMSGAVLAIYVAAGLALAWWWERGEKGEGGTRNEKAA